jgi:5-(carboxyamino)imidazole ribonucleotide synthase
MDVGILGSGQLGWMMITEGRKLENRYFVLDDAAGPATRVADGHLPVGAYRKFVDRCDVVTPEFEHLNPKVLHYASQKGKLFPSIESLDLKRDRSLEKRFLRDRGFPIARFGLAKNKTQALKLAKKLGHAVIKSSHGGYDGKAQHYYGVDGKRSPELEFAPTYVVEEYVEFDQEASIIASRDRDGHKLFHAPSFNQNEEGILLYNEAPYADHGMRKIASGLLDALNYVGVMGVEFFIVDGTAIVNEFAPRVHNSGHHTLHGSSISQFEQHVRVITGLSVPEPVLFRPSGIVNAVGMNIDRRMEEALLSVPETHTYSYHKSDPKRRRKMGHVNITAGTMRELKERIRQVARRLYGPSPRACFSS